MRKVAYFECVLIAGIFKPILAIEVDGFHNHKEGTVQHARDRMKDHILRLHNVPAFRFTTNGSGEVEKIAQTLDAYAQMK